MLSRLISLICLLLLALPLGGCLTAASPRPLNFARTSIDITIGAEDVDCPKFDRNMDNLCKSRNSSGNCVELLQNGTQVYPKMLEDIDSAQKRIGLTVYEFSTDKTGLTFLRHLTDAARRGVEVRLVYDVYGSKEHIDPCAFEELKAAGGQVKPFNPLSGWGFFRYNNRMHRKILVIDGQIAYIGGLNISDAYAGDGTKGYRDAAFRTRGPIVTEVEKMFAKGFNMAGDGWLGKMSPIIGTNWLKQAIDKPLMKARGLWFEPQNEHPAICGDTDLRLVRQSPLWLDNYILNMYINAINSARKNVYIATPYFIPPRLLRRSLARAAQRGVDVRVLTQETTDQPTANMLSKWDCCTLMGYGVKIYGWQACLLHEKVICVDGKWSSVGSCNLDGRALFLNFECNLATKSQEITRKLEEQFLKDISVSRQYTLEDCKKMQSFRCWLYAPVRGQF